MDFNEGITRLAKPEKPYTTKKQTTLTDSLLIYLSSRKDITLTILRIADVD